jgi:hypothetical protein
MRVKDDDCDVPMLSLDDFEFQYWADNTWLTQRQSFAFSMNINASSRWWLTFWRMHATAHACQG